MNPIKLTPDALYLSERAMSSLRGTPLFIGTIHTEAAGSKEQFLSAVVVKVKGKGDAQQVWACRTTGQLFSQASGACLSSSHVRVTDIHPAVQAHERTRRIHRKKSGGSVS